MLKGIITALGFEPPRTYSLSEKLEEILLEAELDKLDIKLSEGCKNTLEVIFSIAKSLEDETTRPRYGVRHADKIILPDELYSIDNVKMFFNV